MDEPTRAITSMLMAVIGVAIIAVIFSTQANTSNVLTSFGTAFSGILGTALSPITGQTSSTSNSNFQIKP